MLSKSFNSGAPEGVGGGGHVFPPSFSDNLTLFQPGGADHAHHITTRLQKFSDPPSALFSSALARLCYVLAQTALKIALDSFGAVMNYFIIWKCQNIVRIATA